MSGPYWLSREFVLALHEDVLTETGGAAGVRDEGLLESALARPLNRFAYEGVEDLIELAATYGVAISSNHPFIDGNKRTAFMALGMFLDDHDLELTASNEEATDIMMGVAKGEMGIDALTAWLRSRVR
ncbi:MAG: type toxin-antitoxin system death-on-curing family toxin [Caulobacter sp.]|nr:type toxin-antitoxin system death-on-curing family toxin [Caulobacter sp.]